MLELFARCYYNVKPKAVSSTVSAHKVVCYLHFKFNHRHGIQTTHSAEGLELIM